MSGALNLMLGLNNTAGQGEPVENPDEGYTITVVLNNPVLYGRHRGAGTVTTSASTTASVIGGVAPFTYEWTGGGDQVFATVPAGPTTKFARYFADVSLMINTTFQCEVTDANGIVAVSGPVDVYLENIKFTDKEL